jgi:hypothetical protein
MAIASPAANSSRLPFDCSITPAMNSSEVILAQTGKHGGIVHAPSIARAYCPHGCLARSRSSNFWILPVDVFGSGPNTTLAGAL